MKTGFTNLNKYIFTRNLGRKQKIDFPATRRECRRLFLMISCDLSKENLTNYGELPPETIIEKARFLHRVWIELEHIYHARVNEDRIWEQNHEEDLSVTIRKLPDRAIEWYKAITYPFH